MERPLAGLFVVNLLGIVRGILGQDPPTTASALTDIAGLIVQLGLSAVFLWQWHNERRERIRRDDQLIEMAAKMAPLLDQATEALRDVHHGLASTVARQAEQPLRHDITARRQELVADEMGALLEQLRRLTPALQQITQPPEADHGRAED